MPTNYFNEVILNNVRYYLQMQSTDECMLCADRGHSSFYLLAITRDGIRRCSYTVPRITGIPIDNKGLPVLHSTFTFDSGGEFSRARNDSPLCLSLAAFPSIPSNYFYIVDMDEETDKDKIFLIGVASGNYIFRCADHRHEDFMSIAHERLTDSMCVTRVVN